MKQNLIYLLLILSAAACSKGNDNKNVKNVIFHLKTDTTSYPADGATHIYVSAELNGEATADRLNVLFKTTAGQFVTSKDTTQSVAAQFIDGRLTATAILIAPPSVGTGTIFLSAQPNLPNLPNNNYILKDTIKLTSSVPEKLRLSANASSIKSDYKSEVTVTAKLTNSNGGNASTGYKVLFENYFVGGPTSIDGIFRPATGSTGGDAQVVSFYTVGNGSIGDKIAIVCTQLDDSGAKTNISDTIYLIVNK